MHRLDVPPVAAVQRLNDHGSASLLALHTVASDVGRGDKGSLKQFAVDGRFAFPTVDGNVAVPAQQRLVVTHCSTGGVDDEFASLQAIEELVVAQVPCGMLALTGEWCVKGDNVAVFQERGEG